MWAVGRIFPPPRPTFPAALEGAPPQRRDEGAIYLNAADDGNWLTVRGWSGGSVALTRGGWWEGGGALGGYPASN